MTADVDLLPLPDGLDEFQPFIRAAIKAYARANVAHATAAKDAEIEALRAEVAKRDGIDPWAILLRAQEAEARAERMAEALTMAENVLSRYPFSASVWPNGMHPQEGITRIRAALNPTTAQEDKT